jgi:outer membrane biosynthesis protein TonB
MGRRFGQDRSGSKDPLPTSSNNNQEFFRMKALISAFALLSFIAASTIPVLPAQAQAQTPATMAPTTTKAPATKKAAAKKSTKKTAAKKAPAKKKVATKKKKATTPPKAPS